MDSLWTMAAVFALVLSSGTVVAVAGSPETAVPSNSTPVVPDDGPDYGVNNSTFQRLWSEDADDATLEADDFTDADLSSRAEFTRQLARSTDVPFSRPPQAVEDWNRGDFGDFQPGGQASSVYPEGASLEDDVYIKDAYVNIFAVQPSTILHSGNETTQYSAPEGHVLALSDYRVAVPQNDRDGSHRERWSVDRTSIESIELSTDGQTLDTGSGHQATLQYSDLSGSAELTVEATITVTLRHVTLDCSNWNVSTANCDEGWTREVDTPEVSKTVVTSRNVVVNQLSEISGTRVQFEADEDRVGAVIHSNTEWSTITVEDENSARSNWWFYTAGTAGWQTILTTNATSTSRTASSARPVQIHAFPNERTAYVPTELTEDGERKLATEEAWGVEQAGPSLRSNIDLESANPYVNADSIAVSSTVLDESAFREITVHGIVRGQSQTVSLPEQQVVRETNLHLSVTAANATHAVVHVRVTENTTNTPVTTGRVTIENQMTLLNSSGEGVVTISNPPAIVRGEYTSVAWWRTDQPYASSEDITKLPANFPEPRAFIQLVVVTILWFLPISVLIFGFDYMSGGALLGLTHRT